jgi:hypothetical protein
MKASTVLKHLESEEFTRAETLLTTASAEDLFKLWRDIAYLQRRASFLLLENHGVHIG